MCFYNTQHFEQKMLSIGLIFFFIIYFIFHSFLLILVLYLHKTYMTTIKINQKYNKMWFIIICMHCKLSFKDRKQTTVIHLYKKKIKCSSQYKIKYLTKNDPSK